MFCRLVTATSPADYESQSVVFEYSALSENGLTMCIAVFINDDLLTEGTELFDVNMSLDGNSPGVSLGNDKTAVTIEGKRSILGRKLFSKVAKAEKCIYRKLV